MKNGKSMVSIVGPIVFLGLFFGLSFVAFRYKAGYDVNAMEEKNAELAKELKSLRRANSRLAKQATAQDGLAATKAKQRHEVIKKALLIVIPERTKEIENAFKEPEPEKEEAKEKKDDKGAKDNG